MCFSASVLLRLKNYVNTVTSTPTPWCGHHRTHLMATPHHGAGVECALRLVPVSRLKLMHIKNRYNNLQGHLYNLRPQKKIKGKSFIKAHQKNYVKLISI